MFPNYKNNQIVIGDKHYTKLNHNDVIILNHNGTYLIKRIIGLPEDTIEYRDNKLFINGNPYKDYGNGNTDDIIVEVEQNKYYYLGDNRENSMDSRVYGTISKDDIIAKVR